jgi:hypothetical protein
MAGPRRDGFVVVVVVAGAAVAAVTSIETPRGEEKAEKEQCDLHGVGALHLFNTS